MDKEQLSELVFASETLAKNLEEFKKLGDFGKIVDQLKGVEHLSVHTIRAHIENIDWTGIVKKTTQEAQEAFLKNNHILIESIKSFEKAQIQAQEAIKTVDMKVLHEAANNTQELIKLQKKVKTKNIFFMGLLMFLINFFMIGGAGYYFGFIQKPMNLSEFNAIKMMNQYQLTVHKKDDRAGYYIEYPAVLDIKIFNSNKTSSKLISIQ